MSSINKKKFISFDSSTNVISNEIKLSEKNLAYLNKLKLNLIPRGSGLSYSLLSAGKEILSVKLNDNKFVLDKNERVVKISSNCMLGESTKKLINDGFSFFVLPGHPNVTIGGAISCDVHGKNQNKYGNFGQYVKSLKLYHPKKGIIECSKDKNNEIFDLTIGGYGMTGLIIEADIKVKKLKSLNIVTTKKKINNLEELKDIYNENLKEHEGVYSWHDLNDKKNFGKGFIFFENFGSRYGKYKMIQNTNILSVEPNFTWKYFRKVYGKAQNNLFYLYNNFTLNKKTKENYYYSNFSNKKQIYFKIMRSANFMEKQIIVPRNFWLEFCEFLKLNLKKIYCYLCVCKFSYSPKKFLRFSGSGISIALNFTLNNETLEFSKKLDEFCRQKKIIINIYKDSYVDANTINEVFGEEYYRFCELLNKYDRDRIFCSNMSKKFKI